ncbi:PR5-like receptor kinase, partial [Macadamia integrifolia]|uniref:PR5-like receptor kinase n=1 Tax=Macadamia integrifolia TaxID=60698 RepID=UPI001C4EFC42
YTYSDIKKMTNSFKDKLGGGGYGDVFKGKLLDGRLVVVKILNDSKGNGEEFINEVASISRTSHVNIVALLGYCFEGIRRALVYEFMPNGSLDNYRIMVLEMVGGRKNVKVSVDHTSEIYFPHWIYKNFQQDQELELEGITTKAEEEIVRKMTLVGLWCIQIDPSHRRSVSKVVEMLEGSITSLQISPKPYLYSPSRLPLADCSGITTLENSSIT